MNLYKIGWTICYVGLGILFLLLFIHRNEIDAGQSQMSKTEGLLFGVPIVTGGLIIIFCRLTGRDEE